MTGTADEKFLGASRLLLNVCKGMRNIIEHDVIKTEMAKVTDLIFDHLKDHYGPFSSFAGLDSNRPLEDTVFTKDGANIIRAMEFISPQEDWVRRAVSYIGNRIEKAAGDGTTSSMMFTCGMLKHMSAGIDQFRPLSYGQLRRAYDELVEDVREGFIGYTMSAKVGDEYKPELVYRLAWMQAYTSSHGDTELADAVAKMFKVSPPSMWSKINFGRRRFESANRFDILVSKHQYEMEADIWNKSVYNADGGEALEMKNATLIVINDCVACSDIHWDEVTKAIAESSRESPVVILCHSGIDTTTWGELTHFATRKEEKFKNCYFTVFYSKPVHSMINDFTAIQAIGGADVSEYTSGNVNGDMTGRPYIIKGVDVYHKGEKLELDNLYVDDRPDTEAIRDRPQFTDTTLPCFSEFAESIQKRIEGLEQFDDTRQIQRERISLERIYNKLRYDKTYTVLIGGNTFDNLAMFDVLDDVLRATIRGLENGITISNNKALYNVVKDLMIEYADDLNDTNLTVVERKVTSIKKWLCESIMHTLEMFSYVVLKMLYPKGRGGIDGEESLSFWRRMFNMQFFHDTNILNAGYVDSESINQYYIVNPEIGKLFTDDEILDWHNWWFNNSVDILNFDSTKWWRKQSLRGVDKTLGYAIDHFTLDDYDMSGIIVQPANADIVMLERFGEIALRFILTERVIVSGGAFVNDKDKKQ